MSKDQMKTKYLEYLHLAPNPCPWALLFRHTFHCLYTKQVFYVHTRSVWICTNRADYLSSENMFFQNVSGVFQCLHLQQLVSLTPFISFFLFIFFFFLFKIFIFFICFFF